MCKFPLRSCILVACNTWIALSYAGMWIPFCHSSEIALHTPSYQEHMLTSHCDAQRLADSICKDSDLECHSATTVQRCLQDFFQKGGTLHCVSNLNEVSAPQVDLSVGDAVYPICSGGVCRSQTLWALLRPFADQIVLFPPHAARHGWDPYNGKINRYRNIGQEDLPDEFSLCFGVEKSLRFGFENEPRWKSIEQKPTNEGIQEIHDFYNQHYFGATRENRSQRRVYVAFSNNAHVTLHRLNQTNESLERVTVVAIDSEDVITRPPEFLHTYPRSRLAYEHFAHLLLPLFHLNESNTR